MEILKSLFIIIVSLSSFLLIIIILLQRSKSEGLGLAFGSSTGEALFGARAGNVLSRATVVLSIVFMLSALILGILFAKNDNTLMSEIQKDLPAKVNSTDASNSDNEM